MADKEIEINNTDTIIEQLKKFINNVHYKLFIKKKQKKLKKEIKNEIKKVNQLNKFKKEIAKIEQEKIFKIESITHEKDDKIIVLTGQELKLKIGHKFLEWLFKFDGYLLYGNKANDFKLFKIKDLSMIYNLTKKKETYNIIDKIGTHKGKPLIMVKYPYAISLNIKDTGQLYYDAKAYYTYVNYATKGNMLKIGEDEGIGGFVKKHLLLIIIIIVIIIFLSTPFGQQFIKDILNQVNNGK